MARWLYNRPSEKCDETEIQSGEQTPSPQQALDNTGGFYYVDNKGVRREGEFLCQLDRNSTPHFEASSKARTFL